MFGQKRDAGGGLLGATPGHVKAHVGWRTHGGGSIPAEKDQTCLSCARRCIAFAPVRMYVGTIGQRYVHTARRIRRIETRDQTRRETGDEKRDTTVLESKARRRKRYDGARDLGTSTSSLGAPQLAGGGAQGRYGGEVLRYRRNPAPLLGPLPSLIPCPCSHRKRVHRVHPARPRAVGLPSRKVFWDKAEADRAFCMGTYPRYICQACLKAGWPAI